MNPRRASTVAAFDVDGTLTHRDTLLPFLAAVAGRQQFARALADCALRAAFDVAPSRRDVAKRRLLRATLAHRSEREVRSIAEAFAIRLGCCGLRADAVARLQAHQRAGHEVVLVSASLDVYLEPLGRQLGVDTVICSRLQVGDDGALTGELAGGNVRGPEKARLLRRWLGERRGAVYAYGDSAGDRELLALADHAWRRTARGWLDVSAQPPTDSRAVDPTESSLKEQHL